MTEKEIFENIDIARKYLARFDLLIPENKIVFDCCYFPPFSEKAFYAQVFCEDNQYEAHCAYTYYANFWGLESYSQTFETVEQANRHNAKVGNVVCKALKLDFKFTNDFIETVKESESIYNEIRIDGISAFIKIFPQKKNLFLLNVGENIIFDKMNSIFREI